VPLAPPRGPIHDLDGEGEIRVRDNGAASRPN
jgi:hypothetical protein